jgi:putative (di)nucleoside polyphosphate hydrolase
MADQFRPNVAAIITNDAGRILVGERIDVPGSWQFPQGGLEPGEHREQGLARELVEEVSLRRGDYEVLERRGPYRYRFPAGYTKKGFQGQEQTYFRVRLLVGETCVQVATAHPEFRTVRWIEPVEFSTAWLPEMKRAVYRQVFADFFNVNIV